MPSLIIPYLSGITFLSIALGIQIVLLPWLVVDHFELGSRWVGWLQAAILFPHLLLLLQGGVLADKNQGLRWFLPLLVGVIILHALLTLFLWSNSLSIFLLLGYAAMLGSLNALMQPWREYFLKQLQPSGLQQIVAKSSLCLYGGQAIGAIMSSQMELLTPAGLSAVQFLCVLLAVLCFYRPLKALTLEHPTTVVDSSGIMLRQGLSEVWQMPAIRSLIAIVSFNGFFQIGVFIVALPLLVIQVYGESVNFFSGLQLVFVLGTLTTSLVVVYRRFLSDPGRRVIFGLLYAGLILLALSARPTPLGLFMLIYLWGAVVGVSTAMGRSLLQSLAPESSRGRMIAIYQLALFGCAPLGALCAGYIIDYWGVLMLLKAGGIASFIAFGATLLTRSLWEAQVES